jgi:type III pantothenate kinase
VTPDIVADVGNSRVKWGRVAGGRITEWVALSLTDPDAWGRQSSDWQMGVGCHWVIAGVNPGVQQQLMEWVARSGGRASELTDYRSVPLKLSVAAQDQVGIDRLLTALAALSQARPRPAVAINIGTAVTVDLIDGDGAFCGGAILPGPQLMALSLHEHTARLPLVDATNLHTVLCPGRDTRTAIELGIGSAVGGAIRQLIEAYTRLLESPPVVLFTGGGMGPFTDLDEDEMWTPEPGDTRFVPTLTLDGIRIAAEALP